LQIVERVAIDHRRSILLIEADGQRIVAGDTSTGTDIYKFRFGPRSTTRRNVDYYFWGWSRPETITFGGQVQDGGAVLGWSFMDLSARLKVAGPDAAWKRLHEITTWFDEVQAGGGYRAYYKKQGAALQGDGAAGGLGLDREFFESLLVPQIMLRGFLGFSPTADGCVIDPKLPKDFPSLTIDRIRLKGLVLAVTASPDTITVRKVSGETDGLFSIAAPGFTPVPPIDWARTMEVRLTR
ncbi:MAG: glycosyl hydrolase family 65 protein, partial [Opitutaceae bacterium]